jgi:NO-binding membrane sensor protein with MHYT domain
MTPSHEPWLVALSLFVAFQGSYVGLHLARQIHAAEDMRRRLLIAAAAFSLALSIWTMHFVGMLAIRLPAAVDFLVLPTLLSFLVCVLVVGFAVFVVGADAPLPHRIALAAAFMGTGIVAMHYLGMYALHASVHMLHDPGWVATSVLLGVTAAGLALWLGFGRSARGSIALPAALMAIAISTMHYAAMAGVTFHAHAAPTPIDMPAVSPGLLAIIVSVVAFVVSGLFLLTLIPEKPGPEETVRYASGEVAAVALAAPGEVAAGAAAPGMPPAPATPRYLGTLPVEKDGRQRRLEASHLVAVRAQAHYTQLFDGETTWFCPLSISEVEAGLDPKVFARVHRSHIVNLDRVATMKNAADAAAVAMNARTPYRAPVSRSRRRWLKQRLEQRLQPAE